MAPLWTFKHIKLFEYKLRLKVSVTIRDFELKVKNERKKTQTFSIFDDETEIFYKLRFIEKVIKHIEFRNLCVE